MTVETAEPLASKKCQSCEGGLEKYSRHEAQEKLAMLSGWRLGADGQRIEKDWQVKDFMAGIDFLDQVAKLAESEGHHPELHLTGYRHVWIELSTTPLATVGERLHHGRQDRPIAGRAQTIFDMTPPIKGRFP